jgi:hypothetical protein
MFEVLFRKSHDDWSPITAIFSVTGRFDPETTAPQPPDRNPLLSSLLPPSLGVESPPATEHTLLAARKELFRDWSRCCPLCWGGVERRPNRKSN